MRDRCSQMVAVARAQRNNLSGGGTTRRYDRLGTSFRNGGAPTQQVAGASHCESRKPLARMRDNVAGWNHREGTLAGHSSKNLVA